MLTGENGILEKSQKASEETNKQTATEKINLKITNIEIATYIEKQQMPNLQDLANGLCNDEENEIEYVMTKGKPVARQLDFVNTEGYDSIFTKLTEYPYEFEIDSSLRLASIDGVKIAEKDNSNEELLQRINALEIAMTAQSEKINNLETTVTNQSNKIVALESEKRVKLINNPVNISIAATTDWSEGDFANITLTDSIENYKYLEIQLTGKSGIGTVNDTIFIATEQLNKYNNSNTWGNASYFWIEGNYSKLAAGCWLKNNKTIHIGGLISLDKDTTNLIIPNIYGIK